MHKLLYQKEKGKGVCKCRIYREKWKSSCAGMEEKDLLYGTVTRSDTKMGFIIEVLHFSERTISTRMEE